MRKIIDWLEQRTGLESTLREFLYEDIPASSGWHQIFGSVALFAFLVQAFTGVLLAINYAPTPPEAYRSLHYIVTELTTGKLIRNLHHWGATVMIIVVVLHLLQVFIYGAYKKPREATWMVGVVLLLVTLAFGLTGYLLPWDNRAYWGTVVTTQIAGSAPFAGTYIQRLLGSETGISVITFARFFTAHVILLPPLTALLIATHVYLVRKHGVTPLHGDTAPKKKFYPEQVFRDTTAVFIAFITLFVLAIVAKVPLERMADPTDTAYIPRPEWYFLFLFQTLKFFKGPLEIVGSTVLPGIAVLILFLVPFIDRKPAVRLAKRTFAFSVAALAVLAWAGLTTAAVASTPKSPETKEIADLPDEDAGSSPWAQLTPSQMAGAGIFVNTCAGCHPAGKRGVGPDLGEIPADRKTIPWLMSFIKAPAQVVPGAKMPPMLLPTLQLHSVAAFVTKLAPGNEQDLESIPKPVAAGALVYETNHCGACHQINGEGQKVGPPLNGVAGRRDRDWLAGHFADPQKYSPGSMMPAYHFSDKDMNNMLEFLSAVPAQ